MVIDFSESVETRRDSMVGSLRNLSSHFDPPASGSVRWWRWLVDFVDSSVESVPLSLLACFAVSGK